MSFNTLGEGCTILTNEVDLKAVNSTSVVVLAEDTSPINISTDHNLTLLKSVLKGANFRDQAVSEVKLQELLDSMLQLQKQYPENEMVLIICVSLINNLKSFLPNDPSPTVHLLNSAILSKSNVSNQGRNLFALSLQFIHALWAAYKEKLSASCDLDGLAQMLNNALDVEKHSQTRAIAFKVAGDTLQSLLSYLNDNQLKTLSKKGVYRHLRTLLKYHNEMEFITLGKVILNVATFSCVSPCTDEILVEGFASTILSCADAVWTNENMQHCICEILSIHCENRQFCEEILKQNLLSRVATCFHHECCHQPLFVLLSTMYAIIPDILSKRCLEQEDFMLTILDIARPDSSLSIEDIEDACILLHNIVLCTVDSPELFEYDIVRKMEDCATKWPLLCAPWACKTVEIVAGSLVAYEEQGNELHREPPQEVSAADNAIWSRAVRFFKDDHHLFLMDMLSNPDLCNKPALLGAIYTAHKNVILASPDEGIREMCSPDNIQLFTFTFIRDTTLFPQLSASIIECACAFMDRVSWKEDIDAIQQANFHVAVVDLLQEATTSEILNKASDLLKCLAELYITDLTPLMVCQTTRIALHVLKAFGCKDGDDCSYVTSLASVLVLMAENKCISAEMYKAGQVHNLLELVQGECSPNVYGLLLFTIGSVACQEYARKQTLVDYKFHLTILQRIKSIASLTPIDVQCICDCFDTINVLACNDFAKNELVENGCITLVLGTLDSETEILFDTRLNLLGTLSSAPILQKQPDTMSRILKMIATILQDGREMTESLIEALTNIILPCQEEDSMLAFINELGITQLLVEVLGMKHIDFRVRQCTAMVIERQFLYMMSIAHGRQYKTDIPTSEIQTQIFNSVQNLTPNIPKAPELDDTSRLKLASLGIDLSETILRIGRVYGVDVGDCYGCQTDNWAENIVIRPHGLTCHQYQRLVDKGWSRRGGVRLYHSSCCHNVECTDWETRIDVHKFDCCSHKRYAKVLKRARVNQITVETHPTHFSQEAFDLYNRYNLERHGWSPICEEEYCKHVVDSPISKESICGIDYGSFHQLYRLDGKLVAVGLIDIVPKGIVSLYMWYSLDKEVSKYSLGVYSALKEIEMVRELSKINPEMKYYYLQGWVEGNKKFAYKVHYSPEEFYCACIRSEWVPSLEAVKNAKRKYINDHTDFHYNHPLCIGPRAWSNNVACAAYENDRLKYEHLTGCTPDVSKMVVCLNGTTYLHLGSMLLLFGMGKYQQDVIKKRFEEILVSMDPDLARNVVVDLKTNAHV